ncbi:response regulator [Lyngbya aestuarii BL J]|uniref:Response regulator n=1 Tax=Lyngbya aestuarii BL J TaxID=1348334 RepID=U7QM21_9CYAN|nr:response regulator [Lyngbya aestuarii]ERT08908.1 response regulator [Lyngbya aestuarii BL J]
MAHILVVEDNNTEAKILTECLQRSGFHVLSVTTAEAAKAMVAKQRFDAILMDVVLPGQSGFGLCRELKNHEQTAGIPIIICSSKSEKFDKNWGLKQGASAYICKPINTEEILQTLKGLINN